MFTQSNAMLSESLSDSKITPIEALSKPLPKTSDTVFPASLLEMLHADLWKEFNSNHPLVEYFEAVLRKRKVNQKGKSSFLVFKNEKYTTMPVKNIAFFYIKNDTATLLCFDKKEYRTGYTLDEVQQLVAPAKFFRMNKDYLVNYTAIKEFEHYFSGKLIVKLILETGQKLLVGEEKAAAFINWMENR